MPISVVLVALKDVLEEFEDDMMKVKRQVGVRTFTATKSSEAVQALSKAQQATGHVDVVFLHHNFTVREKVEYSDTVRKALRDKYPDTPVIGFGSEKKGGMEVGRAYHYWLDWSKGSMDVPEVVRLLRDVEAKALPANYDKSYLKGGSFTKMLSKTFTRSGSVERRTASEAARDLAATSVGSNGSRSSTPQRFGGDTPGGLARTSLEMSGMSLPGSNTSTPRSVDRSHSVARGASMEQWAANSGASSPRSGVSRSTTPNRLDRSSSQLGMPPHLDRINSQAGNSPHLDRMSSKAGLSPRLDHSASNLAMDRIASQMAAERSSPASQSSSPFMGRTASHTGLDQLTAQTLAAVTGQLGAMPMMQAASPRTHTGNPLSLPSGMQSATPSMLGNVAPIAANSYGAVGLAAAMNVGAGGVPANLILAGGMGSHQLSMLAAQPPAAMPMTGQIVQQSAELPPQASSELIHMLAGEVARLRKALDEKRAREARSGGYSSYNSMMA